MGEPARDIGACDVAIVGGGISGCATALELAASGLRVVVVEKDRIGFEASSRNMGAIGTLGKFATDLAAMSVPAWADLHQRMGEQIEFRRGGRLCVAHDATDIPPLQIMLAAARAQDVDALWLSDEAVNARFPELGGALLAGVFCPGDGTVNPVGVMAGYRDLLRAAGVDVREGVAVRDILTSGGAVRGVRTDRGTLRAGRVVCAGGIWAPPLLARAGVRMPMQTLTVIHAETAPLPPLFDYFLRGPTYALRQFRSGVVRISGGFRRMAPSHAVSPRDLKDLRVWLPRMRQNRRQIDLLLDGGFLAAELRRLLPFAMPAARGFEPRLPAAAARDRFAQARRAVPGLAEAIFAGPRGGMVDVTPDGLPVLGPVAAVSGLYLAMGFTGQGFGLGPVTGRLLSRAIQGDMPPILARYRLERFTDAPLAPFPGLG